jgi:hypothetical protein
MRSQIARPVGVRTATPMWIAGTFLHAVHHDQREVRVRVCDQLAYLLTCARSPPDASPSPLHQVLRHASALSCLGSRVGQVPNERMSGGITPHGSAGSTVPPSGDPPAAHVSTIFPTRLTPEVIVSQSSYGSCGFTPFQSISTRACQGTSCVLMTSPTRLPSV